MTEVVMMVAAVEKPITSGISLPKNSNFYIPQAPNIDDVLNPLPEEYDVQQRLNLQTPEIDNLLQQKLNNLRGISNPTPQAQPNEVPFFANVSNCHIPAQTSSFNLSKKNHLNSSGGNDCWFSGRYSNQRRKSQRKNRCSNCYRQCTL